MYHVLNYPNKLTVKPYFRSGMRALQKSMTVQRYCFMLRGKSCNQSTANFLADEITGVTFKASSLNFFF